MTVLVDMGNTRVKFLIEKDGVDQTRGIIENSGITKEWLTKHWSNVSHIIIGSVKAEETTHLITHWANANNKKIQLIESEKSRFGITSSYEIPTSLGVDRWLTFLGANSIFPQTGVVIIDAGTATTVDVLDSEGNHQGGWILSGIDLLLSQLNLNTSKVKFEKSGSVDIRFGKSTSECVNNAAWVATLAMINSGIKKAEQEFNIQHCIILGGNAERLLPFIKAENSKIQIVPDLIFEGLKCYATVNN